jgi:malate dehydrogenase (quinone)
MRVQFATLNNKMSNSSQNTDVDVILIGAGIMSATLGFMLKELQPDLKVGAF